MLGVARKCSRAEHQENVTFVGVLPYHRDTIADGDNSVLQVCKPPYSNGSDTPHLLVCERKSKRSNESFITFKQNISYHR